MKIIEHNPVNFFIWYGLDVQNILSIIKYWNPNF
jgi:hypothetical protein